MRIQAAANRPSRRQWLQQSLGATLAAYSSSIAIEPISRSHAPRFRFSLAAYSYRQLLTGDSPQLSLFDFIDDCVKLGLDGTELTSYYFEDPVTTEYLLRLKRYCFVSGIDVSGTAIRCDFGVPPSEVRSRELGQLRHWIDRAALLNAPVIRIFAGHRPADQTVERTHQLMVDGIQESCDYAARKGVFLALENHGGPTSTAQGLLKIVRDIESNYFGVNLDTGNFHSDEIYDEIALVAPYAVNVQVKVVTSGADGKKQPTDFARLANILRDSNYQGYVVLEYEEAGDPREECRRYIDALRQAFA